MQEPMGFAKADKSSMKRIAGLCMPLARAVAESLEDRVLLSSTGAVSGTVFADPSQTANATGNAGIAGRQVYVDLNENGGFVTGDPTAITDDQGRYALANVPTGTFAVQEVLPQGMGQTTPRNFDQQLTITAGATATQDFGNLTLQSAGAGASTSGGQSLAHSEGYSSDAVTEPDGKLLVVNSDVGTDYNQIQVSRYFPDGTPDDGFGTNGQVFLTPDSLATTYDAYMVVQSDGRIDIAGTLGVTAISDQNENYTVQLDADGSVMNGSLQTFTGLPNSAASYSDTISSIALVPSGNLVLVGGSIPTDNSDLVDPLYSFATELDPSTGARINTFGTNGITLTAYYGDNTALDIPNGSVFVTPGGFDVLTFDVNFIPDAFRSFDSTFQLTGYTNANSQIFSLPIATLANTTLNNKVVAQAVSDGDIYLFGGDGTDLAVVRLNADGTTDTTYGSSGIATIDMYTSVYTSNISVHVFSATVLPNGTALAAEEPSTLGEYAELASDGTPLNGTAANSVFALSADQNAQSVPSFNTISGLPFITTENVSKKPAGTNSPHFVNGGIGFYNTYVPQPAVIFGDTVSDLNVEATAPIASWQTPSPSAVTTAGGTSPELLQVEYQDGIAVDPRTLASSNLQVEFPGGTTETPTYVGLEKTGNNQDLFADYTVPAPSGGWTSANNGTYTIKLLGNQVSNGAHAAAATTLGTFAVNVPAPVVDTTAPTAILATIPTVTTAGTSPVSLVVTFTDNVAVKLSGISKSNLTVTGPGAAVLSVTSASVGTAVDAASMKVTYTVAAPAGGWVAGDNGTYSVALNANAVTDTSTNPVAAATLGSFVVAVGIPSAALAVVPPVTTRGVTSVSLTVTYTDSAAAIRTSSIGNANLIITGPGGTTLSVTGSSAGTATASSGKNQLLVTYTIAAPAGGFAYIRDGAFSVALAAGQVLDAAGTAAIAATLGSFVVNIPVPNITTPLPVPCTVTLGIPITIVQSGNLLLLNATVTGAGGGVPTGTVSFMEGTALLATVTMVGGTASVSSADLSSGAITAVYSGDANYAFSTSAPQSVTITTPPAGAGELTPGLGKALLPLTVVVAGTKHNLTVPVLVTNTGGQTTNGVVHVNLYASADGTLDAGDVLVGTLRKGLKLKAGKSGTLTLHLSGLPAILAAGSYHLLAQVMDSAGFAKSTATASTVTVATPVVTPVVSFAKVTLSATVVSGAKVRGSVVLTIVNNGNISIAGPVTILLYLTNDGIAKDGTLIKSLVLKKLPIAPGRSARISIAPGLIPGIAAQNYQLAAVVQTTAQGGASAGTTSALESATIQVTAAI